MPEHAVTLPAPASLVGVFTEAEEGERSGPAVIFLLAVFQQSDNTAAAGGGALLGLTAAVIVGYALYRGGLRINLAKFFRATGVVLVLVVAGLFAAAAHSAHEAGWLDAMQGQVIDLSAIIRPGSVQSALATGMLGIQPKPVLAEVIAWFAAAIPFTGGIGP